MHSPRLYKYRDSFVLYKHKDTVHTFDTVTGNLTHTLLVQTHKHGVSAPWGKRLYLIFCSPGYLRGENGKVYQAILLPTPKQVYWRSNRQFLTRKSINNIFSENNLIISKNRFPFSYILIFLIYLFYVFHSKLNDSNFLKMFGW